jgi:CubicO group peptidase (beta-lactamase class C family)
MSEYTLPGVGVGIIYGGKPVYLRGFGLAEIEEGKPVTPRTIFRVGSIPKTLTAVGLMQLWEQEKFGLDDPVNDHLKTYQVNATPHAANRTI